MHNPVTEPYLLNALARGAVVVLPNRRAARTLRQAYNERQRTAGLRAWDAAPVLAWTDWTRGLWSALAVQGHELRLLLSPAQEHRLWREIIEASMTGPHAEFAGCTCGDGPAGVVARRGSSRDGPHPSYLDNL